MVEKTKAITKKQIICEYCGEEADCCVNCGYVFKKGDTIYCYYYHHCEKCCGKFLEENEIKYPCGLCKRSPCM